MGNVVTSQPPEANAKFALRLSKKDEPHLQSQRTGLVTRHYNAEDEDAALPKGAALIGKGTRRGERPYEKRKKLVFIPTQRPVFPILEFQSFQISGNKRSSQAVKGRQRCVCANWLDIAAKPISRIG